MSSSNFGLKKAIPTASAASNGGQGNTSNGQKSIIEIYTDWANHYLDKVHGGKKRVRDLQTELRDGVILAEVIEAVMGAKVPEVNKRPKTSSQMTANVQHCLKFLVGKGVAVSEVTPADIREGHLKAILGLFFQLSRFKQQQKVMLTTDRSSTPKIPSVPPSPARHVTSIPSPVKGTRPNANGLSTPPSMLERLKQSRTHLHQQQHPEQVREIMKKGLGKRTSSSSGFSSARSIGSESSVSLSSDTNFPSPSALRRINEREPSPKASRKLPASSQSPKRSPKLARATEIKDYGPIDTGSAYPPHHASNLRPTAKFSPSRTNSRIPGGGVCRIPSSSSSSGGVVVKAKPTEESTIGCTVRPLLKDDDPQKGAETSENDESTARMTASFHSRTKSLPRTRRREDGSPSPANVAVVSPMLPAKNEKGVETPSDTHLKGLLPLGPLGLFAAAGRTGEKPTHQLPSFSRLDQFSGGGTTLVFHQGGSDGYMSDGDAFNLKSNQSQTTSPPSQSSIDDGYLSEGGASFYARKIQSRIALEKQKTVEEQNRKLRQALPEVLSNNSNEMNSTIYRVVGGRNKQVQKAEMGMQTDHIKQPLQDHYDWKQAMAYNARILSSQEKAMDEYLKRQRANAEQHIHQMYQSPYTDPRHRAIGTKEDGRGIVRLQEPVKMPLTGLGPRCVPSSTPSTPTGRRRNNPEATTRYPPMGEQQHCSGGSLERKLSKIQQTSQQAYSSDSEYVQYICGSSSPGSQRKSYSNNQAAGSTQIPSNVGSKSLPKGASSLNYGLMMDKIQAKRQLRQYKAANNDGSLSDSNYAIYERSSSPYSWLQPASTYAMMATNGNDHYMTHMEANKDALGSNESLNSVTSSIQQARANSLTKARLMLHNIRASSPHGNNPRAAANMSETNSYSSLSTGNRNIEETDYYGVIPFRGNKQPTGVLLHQDSGSEDNSTEAAIIKLRRELASEHEKVLNLTSQLATNAHVVAAFEQSLANMTARLQHLTATAEKKDHELNELRRNIELYKQCGVDAGLIKGELRAQQSSFEMVSDYSGDESTSSAAPVKSKKSSSTPKRSGWLRNSFSKAFNKQQQQSSAKKKDSISDAEESNHSSPKHYARASSALGSHQQSNSALMSPIKASKSSDTIDSNPSGELVSELKRQLMEKENLLTETRLEALSSAHQLESLRDTVTKMRNELLSIRSENEKLHSIVHVQKSLSQNSLNNNEPLLTNDDEDHENGSERRHSSTLSESSILSGPSSLDLSATTDPANTGKLVPVAVLNTDKSYTKIGTISVSGRSNWDLLDSLVHRLFSEYVMRVDPTSNLGLSADSIGCYQVGEIKRSSMSRKPELLPYGYLVGDTTDIMIILRKSSPTDSVHVDALAFETLTPKAIMQRYVSLLLDNKRMVLSGPSGSGKTYLAHKIANFLAANHSKGRRSSVASFAVQRTNVPELKDFLRRCCSPEAADCVLILDNLHLAGSLEQALSDCPLPPNTYILGTLNSQCGQGQLAQTLQLQFNFRFVALTTHAEPLKGMVGRYLRQRLLGIETRTRLMDGEMSAAVDWVAKAHLHLNRFLESHHPSNADAIAPSHFMDCPIGHEEDGATMEASSQGEQIQRWFLKVWNEVLRSRLTESIREGLQLYGMRSGWEDPIKYLVDSWPWANSAPLDLAPILPEDVGYDHTKAPDELPQTDKPLRPSSTGTSLSSGTNNTDSDPLFNMLLHLQEANNETH